MRLEALKAEPGEGLRFTKHELVVMAEGVDALMLLDVEGSRRFSEDDIDALVSLYRRCLEGASRA